MSYSDHRTPFTALPMETAELLHSYCYAFTNLYGCIPLQDALQIIRRQNPLLMLSEQQLKAFAKWINEREDVDYGFVNPLDWEEDEESPVTMSWVLVASCILEDVDEYYNIIEQQGMLSYYVPPREELLRYDDEAYLLTQPPADALLAYLRDELKVPRAEALIEDVRVELLYDYLPAEQILMNHLSDGDYGFRGFQSNEQITHLLDSYAEPVRNVRRNVHRGHTLMEALGECAPERKKKR